MSKYKQLLRKNARNSKILTLDWLTITVDDVFSKLDFNNLQVEVGEFFITINEGVNTRHFNKRAEIYKDGFRVATVVFESSHPTILVDQAQIRFENALFYSGQIKSIFTLLKGRLGLSGIKVSRADVACDGVHLHGFINQHLKDEARNRKIKSTIHERSTKTVFRVLDKRNIVPWLGDTDDYVNTTADQFYIGTLGNKSSKQKMGTRIARYYNKSKELREKTGKQYIDNYFKANGITGEVYRYELQLNSAFFKNLDFDVEKLFDPQELLNLFTTANKNFFEFRFQDNANTARCTPVELFSSLGTASVYSKLKREVLDKVRSVKLAIKTIAKQAIMGCLSHDHLKDERDKAIDTVWNMLLHNDLTEWFSRVSGSLWFEIERKCNQMNIKPAATQLKLFSI